MTTATRPRNSLPKATADADTSPSSSLKNVDKDETTKVTTTPDAVSSSPSQARTVVKTQKFGDEEGSVPLTRDVSLRLRGGGSNIHCLLSLLGGGIMFRNSRPSFHDCH